MIPSAQATDLNWLVTNFARQVTGVQNAVMVSPDGLPIASSDGLDRDAASRFSAMAFGLIGLAYGAACRLGGGAVREVIIEMENALLVVMGLSDGSCLSVVATPECDTSLVVDEMALLIESTDAVLAAK